MGKVLYPFAVSVILFILLQFFHFSTKNQENRVFVRNSVKQGVEKEIAAYILNFNPDLAADALPVEKLMDQSAASFNEIQIIPGPVYHTSFRYLPNPALENHKGSIDTKIIPRYGLTKIPGHKTGMIAMSGFNTLAYISFMNAMEKMAGTSGIDTLVLDLRNCREGLDGEAIKIANQLIFDENIPMVEEIYFNGTTNLVKSSGKVFFPVKKIYVLINKNTSGIAVFFTHILKKAGLTQVLGSYSGESPLLVRYFPLSDGRYLRLPVGSYRYQDAGQKEKGAEEDLLQVDTPLDDQSMDTWIQDRF